MRMPSVPFAGNSTKNVLLGETVKQREPEKVSTEIGKALSPAEVRKALALEETVKYGRLFAMGKVATFIAGTITVLCFLFGIWTEGDNSGRWAGTACVFGVLAFALGFLTAWASDLRKTAIKAYLGKLDTDGYGNSRYY